MRYAALALLFATACGPYSARNAAFGAGAVLTALASGLYHLNLPTRGDDEPHELLGPPPPDPPDPRPPPRSDESRAQVACAAGRSYRLVCPRWSARCHFERDDGRMDAFWGETPPKLAAWCRGE